jgi:hypothetical protein
MKKNAFLTILMALSMGSLMLNESKAEQLTAEEMAKYKEVSKAVRKANPDLDAQKKALDAAYRDAILKIDSTLADVVTLKSSEQTPEQQAKLKQAKKDAEKADPTLKERTKANAAVLEAAMAKADPSIEPILAKKSGTAVSKPAVSAPAAATPAASAAPATPAASAADSGN